MEIVGRLGQELTEVTRGEMEVSRAKSHVFRSHLSVNHETSTTIALAV